MSPHILEWLTANSLAVQAAAAMVGVILTAVLVCTTIIYAGTTKRILAESQKSREAAEKQAKASQENLEMLKRKYESELGLGPQIVLEALLDAKRLIVYWSEQAVSVRAAVPEPDALVRNNLHSVVQHARSISAGLPSTIGEVIANLRNAKSEFDKMRNSRPGPYGRSQVFSVGPLLYLNEANKLVDAAVEQFKSGENNNAVQAELPR